MATSPNDSKHVKDVTQLEFPTQKGAVLRDAIGITEPNATWGAEPNFNLNLNLTSPTNPRSSNAVASKLQGGKGGGKPGVKEGVTMEMDKLASGSVTLGKRDDPSGQKSRIPALSRSPTAETKSRDEQRLKSPNVGNTPTLSPNIHTHKEASPKPQHVELTGVDSRTAGRDKTLKPKAEKHVNKTTTMQLGRKDDAGQEVSLKTPSLQTLQLPTSPKVPNQKGDRTTVSPKLANRTPTLVARIRKPDPQTGHDSRMNDSERAELTLLKNKTPKVTSLSPQPPQRSRNNNASGSKENLDSRDSSSGSGSKPNARSSSNSKVTTASKDSPISKTGTGSKVSPYSKTGQGSTDSLDSKSGSASKPSSGSKDSLDSKTVPNPRASPNSKSRTGSNLDIKNTAEIKAHRTGLESKSAMGSKDNLHPKSPLDSKVGSEVSPTVCAPSKPTLTASGFKVDIVGSVSPSSPWPNPPGSQDTNTKIQHSSTEPSPEQMSGSDISSLTLSPKPGSASRSPLTNIGQAGLTKEVQRSPGSTSGETHSCSKVECCARLDHPELLSTCW